MLILLISGISYDPWSIAVGSEVLDISYLSQFDYPEIEISGTRYNDVFYDSGLGDHYLSLQVVRISIMACPDYQSELDLRFVDDDTVSLFADPPL